MGQFIILIALLAFLPLAVWFWGERLKNLAAAITVAEKEGAQSQSDVETEERVTNARLAFYRDLFLAVLSTGLTVYFIVSLLAPALRALAGYFLDVGSALQAYEPFSQGGQMESIINVAIRILLSISAFLITFGMSAAVLPEIYLQAPGSRLSMFLSYATAFFLAAAFSLWLGTSTTAFGGVFDQLTRGYLGVVTSVLSILFGGIGASLIWRRVKTLIPK